MKRVPFYAAIVVLALVWSDGSRALSFQFGSTEIAGGRGGTGFADAELPSGTRVLEIHIRSGDQVDSVQMQFSLPDGRTGMSPRRGGRGGQLRIFRLDPGEYITGLSGRYGDYIDSIRVHTNRRTSEPFGGGGGDRDYRIEVPGGNQALGFAGRAGDLLDAIGLIYAPVRDAQSGQTTLIGGRGGSPFRDRPIPSGARVAEVRVRAGDLIDAVQMVYLLRDGRSQEGAWNGGRGGRSGVFRLEADEYIVGLSGRQGDQIDSLRIHTNKRTSELFGGRGGNRDFRIEVPRGTQAIGFAGRAGDTVDAIGLVYEELGSPARRSPWQRPRRP